MGQLRDNRKAQSGVCLAHLPGMPIIGLWDSSNLVLSRRVASPPASRSGPARVHVERFSPKAGAPRRLLEVEAEYLIDGPVTDPLVPVVAAPPESK